MYCKMNWVQGSIFGIKVSGTLVPGGSILASQPIEGKSLISGGAFGIEGSIICSVIFLVPTMLIIRKMREIK